MINIAAAIHHMLKLKCTKLNFDCDSDTLVGFKGPFWGREQKDVRKWKGGERGGREGDGMPPFSDQSYALGFQWSWNVISAMAKNSHKTTWPE